MIYQTRFKVRLPLGHPAAVPSADSKPAVVAHPDRYETPYGLVVPGTESEHIATALWISETLGLDFPAEKVYWGHVSNFRAWLGSR